MERFEGMVTFVLKEGVFTSSSYRAGIAQLARASAFQAEGRGFESRFPLQKKTCPRSSGVEHFLGKEEVAGSIPAVGSIRVLGGLRGASPPRERAVTRKGHSLLHRIPEA